MLINLSEIYDTSDAVSERRDNGRRRIEPSQLPRLVLGPGSKIGGPDQSGECSYLIERGLIANYVDVDGVKPTCVGLAGVGEVIGLSALLGRSVDVAARTQAIVPVQLLRVSSPELCDLLGGTPALLAICLQQLQASITEIGHVAACNARHLLPARCAHWLLRLQARLGDVLPVTHEFLSSILGVRRAGITLTLQNLQRSGAIRQQRGSVVILDAHRLRASACTCPIGVARPLFPMPVGEIGTPRSGPMPWRAEVSANEPVRIIPDTLTLPH